MTVQTELILRGFQKLPGSSAVGVVAVHATFLVAGGFVFPHEGAANFGMAADAIRRLPGDLSGGGRFAMRVVAGSAFDLAIRKRVLVRTSEFSLHVLMAAKGS